MRGDILRVTCATEHGRHERDRGNEQRARPRRRDERDWRVERNRRDWRAECAERRDGHAQRAERRDWRRVRRRVERGPAGARAQRDGDGRRAPGGGRAHPRADTL